MNRAQQAIDTACNKAYEALNTLEFGLNHEQLRQIEGMREEIKYAADTLSKASRKYYMIVTIHE